MRLPQHDRALNYSKHVFSIRHRPTGASEKAKREEAPTHREFPQNHICINPNQLIDMAESLRQIWRPE